MAGETIRDVVIRVSVENGSVVLKPPDTSAWTKKIAEMQSMMDKLKSDAASIQFGAAGSFQGFPVGSQSVAEASRASDSQAAQSGGTPNSAQAAVEAMRREFADTQTMINKTKAMQAEGVAASAQRAQQIGSEGESSGGGVFSTVGGAVAQRAGGIASFAAANPQIVALGVAAAGAAVGVKAYLVAVEEARTRFIMDSAAEAQYSRLSAVSTGNIRTSRIQSQQEQIQAREFLGDYRLRGSQIRSSLNLEENIVGQQAQMRGQGTSEQRIGDVRQRGEAFEGIRQQQEVEKLRATDLDKKISEMNALRDSVSAEQQRTNANFDRNERDIRKQALPESWYSTGNTNWFTEMTGGVSRRKSSETQDRINKELTESQQAREEKEGDFKNQNKSILESIIRLEKQREESLTKQASLTQEQLALGQSILDQEKSRTRGEKEAFGSMSLAEQEITRQANEKAKRIELAKAEGKDTKEELTPIELGLAGSFSNTALGRVASLQKQKRADESGIFEEQDTANQQLEQQLAQAKDKAVPEVKGISDRLDKLSAENAEAVDKLADIIESKFATKAALEELGKRLQMQGTENRNKQVTNRQWTGG